MNKNEKIACSGNPVHTTKTDLLNIPVLGSLIKSHNFLFAVRGIVLILFVYSIWFGLLEPSAENNHVTTPVAGDP